MKKLFKWILIILAVLIALLFVLFACVGIGTHQSGDTSPEALQKTKEEQINSLKTEYDKIETSIGNLNVTGHGDFINDMEEQQSYCDYNADKLQDAFGDDNELINLLKQAWTTQGQVCEVAADQVRGKATLADFQAKCNELTNTLNQIKAYQIPES